MNQDDILYIIEQLNDGITNKDWDIVYEARESLKEFLDNDGSSNDE